MMDITNPDGLREMVFAIARDGARPHIKAGIVARLSIIHTCLSNIGDHEIAAALKEEISALEQMP